MKTSKLVFDLQDTPPSSDPLDARGGRCYPNLPLGVADFTICLQAECASDAVRTGDLISQFDAKTRTGFTLGLTSLEATCSSRAAVRQLSFGIDAGSEPVWVEVGNPGGAAILPFGFCEFQGELYAAVCSGAADGKGGVFRFEHPNRWVDCGCPCRSNSITALAVHDGMLFAAASYYDTQGTQLPAAGNTTRDSHVYAYDGVQWRDYGKVADCQILAGMTVLEGILYVSAFEMFSDVVSHPQNGLYRMREQGQWEFCGNPGERISPIIARDGKIMTGGYNKGGIYTFDPVQGEWEEWGTPPYEETTQIYSFVEYEGELLVGTWRSAKVFVVEGPHRFRDLGVLGTELEVMGMAVYNGKLYAGTLPLARVYRYDGGTDWTLVDRLEHTETEYRRVWSMGFHGGRLFCGAVPSGKVFAMTAGKVAALDEEFPVGPCQITAVRRGGDLAIYWNGEKRSRQTPPVAKWQNELELDLSNDVPLLIGGGPNGPWHGKITDLKIFPYAMTDEEIAEEAAKARPAD